MDGSCVTDCKASLNSKRQTSIGVTCVTRNFIRELTVCVACNTVRCPVFSILTFTKPCTY